VIAPIDKQNGKMEDAVRVAAERARRFRDEPGPSFASRLGQIGVLGWAIVAPILIGVAIGRWLDAMLKTGIFFTAPLIMLGAAAGFWTAWRWMHRQ
jgi:ATP synthase protein I